MLQQPRCQVIALEEHYWDTELASQYAGADAIRDPELSKRLYDLGDFRIKEMDEAGIDVQVISHDAPATQKLSGEGAMQLTRRINDRLRTAVSANPTLRHLRCAADQRSCRCRRGAERTVELGFKGR